MQDRAFVSWHMLECTWCLRLPIKGHRFDLMIFGKTTTIFVKSSLFSKQLRHNLSSNNQVTQFTLSNHC